MRPETLQLIQDGGHPKGDVFAVARIAGIQAAKRTHELIPLCHPLLLTSVKLELQAEAPDAVRIRARCRLAGQTGVEMEALTAASVAAPDHLRHVQGGGPRDGHRAGPVAGEARRQERPLPQRGGRAGMIRVQYFARYREALGIDGEQLNWDAGLATLGALRQLLVERGGAWERTLGEQNLMCAQSGTVRPRRAVAGRRRSRLLPHRHRRLNPWPSASSRQLSIRGRSLTPACAERRHRRGGRLRRLRARLQRRSRGRRDVLEHYPGMTEKALGKIAAEAGQRWPLLRLEILHRIGRLEPGEPIVFVGCASATGRRRSTPATSSWTTGRPARRSGRRKTPPKARAGSKAAAATRPPRSAGRSDVYLLAPPAYLFGGIASRGPRFRLRHRPFLGPLP